MSWDRQRCCLQTLKTQQNFRFFTGRGAITPTEINKVYLPNNRESTGCWGSAVEFTCAHPQTLCENFGSLLSCNLMICRKVVTEFVLNYFKISLDAWVLEIFHRNKWGTTLWIGYISVFTQFMFSNQFVGMTGTTSKHFSAAEDPVSGTDDRRQAQFFWLFHVLGKQLWEQLASRRRGWVSA